MINKLTCISAIAASTILMSSGAVAHVKNGALSSGNGQPVSSSYETCVRVSSGKFYEKCDPKPPAPKPEPVVEEPVKPVPVAPKPTLVKVTETISLSGDASFATNSAELTDDGMKVLDSFIADLGKVEPTKLILTGHADSRGNDAYNQKLSERRANSVANYLISKGVSSSIITASGKGETQPVASNETSAGRAQNRRVDIDVTANKTVYK